MANGCALEVPILRNPYDDSSNGRGGDLDAHDDCFAATYYPSFSTLYIVAFYSWEWITLDILDNANPGSVHVPLSSAIGYAACVLEELYKFQQYTI